ncbi:hypothetical protein QUF80_23785 [Desulfococcaceae bacterium HSG8]|nr:hypothetical protein [Desulfococcaceae bacterium HSG8]
MGKSESSFDPVNTPEDFLDDILEAITEPLLAEETTGDSKPDPDENRYKVIPGEKTYESDFASEIKDKNDGEDKIAELSGFDPDLDSDEDSDFFQKDQEFFYFDLTDNEYSEEIEEEIEFDFDPDAELYDDADSDIIFDEKDIYDALDETLGFDELEALFFESGSEKYPEPDVSKRNVPGEDDSLLPDIFSDMDMEIGTDDAEGKTGIPDVESQADEYEDFDLFDTDEFPELTYATEDSTEADEPDPDVLPGDQVKSDGKKSDSDVAEPDEEDFEINSDPETESEKELGKITASASDIETEKKPDENQGVAELYEEGFGISSDLETDFETETDSEKELETEKKPDEYPYIADIAGSDEEDLGINLGIDPEIDFETDIETEKKFYEEELELELYLKNEPDVEIEESEEPFELDLDVSECEISRKKNLEFDLDLECEKEEKQEEDFELELELELELGPGYDEDINKKDLSYSSQAEKKSDNDQDEETEPLGMLTNTGTVQAADVGENAEPDLIKQVLISILIFSLAVLLAAGYELYRTRGHLSTTGDTAPGVKMINGRFVKNSRVGTLFVISGKLENKVIKLLKVKGKLRIKGRFPVEHERSCCGNILSDEELYSLDPDTIRNRLSYSNGSNVKTGSDKKVPFMLVFFDVPDQLPEFTIEFEAASPDRDMDESVSEDFRINQ